MAWLEHNLHDEERGRSFDYPREQIPTFDRRVAPALALCIIGLVNLGLAGCWLAYLWSGETQFEFGP